MPDGAWLDVEPPRVQTPQDVAAAFLDDIAQGRRDTDGERLWVPKPEPRRPYRLRRDDDLRGLLEAWRNGEGLDDDTKAQVREWQAWRHESSRVRSENEARLATLLGTIARLRQCKDELSKEIAREVSRQCLQTAWGMTPAQVREATEPGAARMAAALHVGVAPWRT